MLNQKQLVWRCRRGVRELDVVFNLYLKDKYLQLDTTGKEAFERLLDVQDPVIMDWLFGKSTPEDLDIYIIIKELREISGLNSR